jgi:hypothetical protein
LDFGLGQLSTHKVSDQIVFFLEIRQSILIGGDVNAGRFINTIVGSFSNDSKPGISK